MLAEWRKPPEVAKMNQDPLAKGEVVLVMIHGYSTASVGDKVYPVAIVSEVEGGSMKYVEVKFLKVLDGKPSST